MVCISICVRGFPKVLKSLGEVLGDINSIMKGIAYRHGELGGNWRQSVKDRTVPYSKRGNFFLEIIWACDHFNRLGRIL